VCLAADGLRYLFQGNYYFKDFSGNKKVYWHSQHPLNLGSR
jgi:hypothetical protein